MQHVNHVTARHDLTLELVRKVAWEREPLALSSAAKRKIAARRATFERLLAEKTEHGVYGVNQGQGEMIRYRLSDEQLLKLARLKPYAAATSFGELYPERVTRAMVLARLANIIEGHAFSTLRLAEALVDLLNHGPMPEVAATGQGGAGEILCTYPLYAALASKLELEPGERSTLINGSSCAAALLADAALASRRRLGVVEEVLALAIEAFNAPREHYDPALGQLWGGRHHEAAFNRLNALLGPTARKQRDHQGPVSYRIVPAVLANGYWALAQAEENANLAIGAVTHNPTYFEPDAAHPLGRAASTGGFHQALAAPLMDGLAAVWADLCLLSERLCCGLLNGRASGYPDFLDTRGPGETDGHGALGYLPMALAGFVEEARGHAQRTFIPAVDASVFGQDDVGAPAFLAWPKVVKAGETLDRALSVLAVTASQALHLNRRDDLSPPLRKLLTEVRSVVPPLVEDRVLGPELKALSQRFTARVYDAAGPA